MKYFCRMHRPELLGRDAAEMALTDMISRIHDDMHTKFGKHCFGAGDTPEL